MNERAGSDGVSAPTGSVTWRDLWAEAARAAGGRPQGRWLCETASGLTGAEFLDQLHRPASQRGVAHLDAMLGRLGGGEPLQYVLGHWAFRRLDVMVDRRVLIPRPETEEVAGVAIELAREMPTPILCADLGTGSGVIGLSLAAELPLGAAAVWLTDASADALHVARANLAGLGRAGAGVRMAEGSWFDALSGELRGRLDLVVSNPPYVASGDPAVEAVVRDWEPSTALFAGADGLDAIADIVAAAPVWLRPGGWLVLEIGAMHGAAVRDLLAARGFVGIDVRRDASGRERIAVGRNRPSRLDGSDSPSAGRHA